MESLRLGGGTCILISGGDPEQVTGPSLLLERKKGDSIGDYEDERENGYGSVFQPLKEGGRRPLLPTGRLRFQGVRAAILLTFR